MLAYIPYMDPMGKQIDLILLFYWLPDFGTIPNWLTREVATEDLKVFSNPFSPNTKLPRNHGLAGDEPHIWDPFSGCFILYMGEWDHLYLLLFQLDHICKSELGMPLNWLKDNLAVPILLGQLNPSSQARQSKPVMSGYTTVIWVWTWKQGTVPHSITCWISSK